MIQRSIQFCHACGSRAAPRALYCVDCGARLAPTGRHARSPRPAGVRVGGRYRLRRLIDMGGNGAVYEAQHELLGTTHALKESLADDQPSLEQFLIEARLMARLDHPVLVQVSDYFIEPSGAAFLVMDYVSGETLQHKLEQPVAGYSVSDVISWLLQLCSALEYLHDYRDPGDRPAAPSDPPRCQAAEHCCDGRWARQAAGSGHRALCRAGRGHRAHRAGRHRAVRADRAVWRRHRCAQRSVCAGCHCLCHADAPAAAFGAGARHAAAGSACARDQPRGAAGRRSGGRAGDDAARRCALPQRRGLPAGDRVGLGSRGSAG